MFYIFYLMHFARFPLLQVLPLVKPLYNATGNGIEKVRKKFVKSQKSFPNILADFLRTPALNCTMLRNAGF